MEEYSREQVCTFAYRFRRRVLVGFGEKVGFAPTLEEALNELFDGKSGAKTAADAGVDEKAADSETTADSSATSTDAASLEEALKNASDAMKDSEEAMKKGDWAAYGEAQDRLNKALEDAMKADGVSTE